MRLTRITIENFGIYGGRNEFDISASSEKPIVLCMGRNGAGKTTLFESIPLCLYGEAALDVTKKQYKDIISGIFHKYGNGRADTASISLEFKYFQDKVSEYHITRTWYNDGKINEILRVEKNGKQLDLEGPEIQALIDQMLPRSITRLFFFNGEELVKMTRPESNDEYLKTAFENMLGLDLVNQLHNDIGRYVLRNSGTDSKKADMEATDNETKKQEIVREIERLGEKQVSVKAEINSLRNNLSACEERFTRLGGEFAKRREELTAEKAELESKLSQVDSDIRSICSDTLPFSLVPELVKDTVMDLQMDIAETSKSFEREILEKGFADVMVRLEEMDNSDQIRRAFEEKINSIPKSGKTKFNLSVNEMRVLMQTLPDMSLVPRHLDILTKSRNKISKHLKKTIDSLKAAPKDDEIGPVFSEIAAINREIGELEWELNNLKNLESQKKSSIVILNSQIRKDLSAKKKGRRLERGVELGPQIQGALNEYAGSLREKKIAQLEAHMTECALTLLHKKQVRKVKIDPNTLHVVLYDESDDELPRFSAGESHTYALVTMWALAKTSGMALPFVIDSPLGRLDRTHKDNMLERFYHSVANQTIVMSTDLEITESEYEALRDKISRTFTIQYDPKQQTVSVKNGYWLVQEAGIVS